MNIHVWLSLLCLSTHYWIQPLLLKFICPLGCPFGTYNCSQKANICISHSHYMSHPSFILESHSSKAHQELLISEHLHPQEIQQCWHQDSMGFLTLEMSKQQLESCLTKLCWFSTFQIFAPSKHAVTFCVNTLKKCVTFYLALQNYSMPWHHLTWNPV